MPAFLAEVALWLLREVIIKFVIFTALFALLAVLIPKVIALLTPYLGVSSLASAFSSVAPSVWYFLDFFQIGYAVPLIISAYITRFTIRRLPVVG